MHEYMFYGKTVIKTTKVEARKNDKIAEVLKEAGSTMGKD